MPAGEISGRILVISHKKHNSRRERRRYYVSHPACDNLSSAFDKMRLYKDNNEILFTKHIDVNAQNVFKVQQKYFPAKNFIEDYICAKPHS